MDITMCPGTGCERKMFCLRHVGEASYLQPWFVAAPIFNNGCDFFIKDIRDGIYSGGFGNDCAESNQHASPPDVAGQSNCNDGADK